MLTYIHKELQFLQSLTMNSEQKRNVYLLRSTERGGRTFPVMRVTIHPRDSQWNER